VLYFITIVKDTPRLADTLAKLSQMWYAHSTLYNLLCDEVRHFKNVQMRDDTFKRL
jgi:hypothetical protein